MLENDVTIEGTKILPKNDRYNEEIAVAERIIINKTKLEQLLVLSRSTMTFQRSTEYRFKYALTQLLLNVKRCTINDIVRNVTRDICGRQVQTMVEALLIPIYVREAKDTEDGLPIFFRKTAICD